MPEPNQPCPCGSDRSFSTCCGPLLAGGDAPTAEALMRSRYTAHVFGDDLHLARTWHPDHRPPAVRASPSAGWTGLEITATERGRELDADGTVTFVARRTSTPLRERSRFVRLDGVWVYVDGDPVV